MNYKVYSEHFERNNDFIKDNKSEIQKYNTMFFGKINEFNSYIFNFYDETFKNGITNSIFISVDLNTSIIKECLLKKGINPSDIVVIEDISKIPFCSDNWVTIAESILSILDLKEQYKEIGVSKGKLYVLVSELVRAKEINEETDFSNLPVDSKLKNIIINYINSFSDTTYDINDMIPENIIVSHNDIFKLVKKITNICNKNKNKGIKGKQYLFNLDNKEDACFVSYMSRRINEIVPACDSIKVEYPALIFSDFIDFNIEAIGCLGSNERRGSIMNIFFNESSYEKDFYSEESLYSFYFNSTLKVLKNEFKIMEKINEKNKDWKRNLFTI